MTAEVDGDEVLLAVGVADVPGASAVVLDCDPAVPGPRAFARSGEGWELLLPRPPLQRVEYRLRVERPGAEPETVTDPGNPATVSTAFGRRSVLEMPGYAPPAWLDGPAVGGTRERVRVRGETETPVPVTVWSPAGATRRDPMPLLVVHDGPEYDERAALTRYSAAHIASGTLPQHRVALLHPVERDAWYSASPRYLRTGVEEALRRLTTRYAVQGPVVAVGASLGGLTALLAGLRAAPLVGGVLAQSGSFFQVRHDDSESGFRHFGRISHTVAGILDTREVAHPLAVSMTCGALEENAANNADMAAALRRAGHTVTYRTLPDLHNYTAWRDALDPALTQLLHACWPQARG